MFRIVTNQAMEACIQLEQCMTEFMTQNRETETVIRNLGSLSGMGDVLARLQGAHGRMQEESRILRQMTQGLDKTVLYYTSCEKRICENTEQGAIRYERKEIVMNDFSGISDLLGDVLAE